MKGDSSSRRNFEFKKSFVQRGNSDGNLYPKDFEDIKKLMFEQDLIFWPTQAKKGSENGAGFDKKFFTEKKAHRSLIGNLEINFGCKKKSENVEHQKLGHWLNKIQEKLST